MKNATMFLLIISMLLTMTKSIAGNTTSPSYKTSNSQPTPGLSWRCGKNNPATWGTFGNGCLKQKRKAKKNSAAMNPGKVKLRLK
ncbi:hypothetical protein MNBD_GAMMA12-2594 [hydrothermal vent metagenome]|uniref:Uncharacterized protein n=1 Tax=hydrothermal vent metagenome TaxID=652676 RepID=A0A3B0YNK1_9ZZZZ